MPPRPLPIFVPIVFPIFVPIFVPIVASEDRQCILLLRRALSSAIALDLWGAHQQDSYQPMHRIPTGIGEIKRLVAAVRLRRSSADRAVDEDSSPARHVEESLDILETALSRLARGEQAAAEETPAETQKQLKRKIKRLERQCERYAAQVQDLKESLGKSTSASHKREEELTTRVRRLNEDAQSSTALIEESLREIEKVKKAYNELRKKSDSEDYVAGRIEEETQRISREADEQIEALKKKLNDERQGHRKSLVEQAKKIAALRRELRQARAMVSKLEEQLSSEKGESDALAARIHRWKSNLDRHLESLSSVVPAKLWRLKLDDGSIFRPVGIGELYDWATECRIGPDHELSQDGHAWIKAANVEDLRMDWFVQLVDGKEYGPINVFAVSHLLAEGTADPSARVTHRSTGTAYRADGLESVEIAELRECNVRLLAQLRAVRRTVADEKDWGDELLSDETPAATSPPSQPPPKLIQRKILRS